MSTAATKRQQADEYSASLVDLMNALEEWKDAGVDVSVPVSAIQRFIHAICAQRDEVMLDAIVRSRK